ncbi:MAG: Xanthine dehydrogenase [Chloroflexi bacterium]|nr:Xanthine dehydrogenase [Chloroflexota bacterium]
MSKKEITLSVNGKTVVAAVDSSLSLLRFLRESLYLTGAKEGCGQGECGACTVLINNKPINSCMIPVISIAGCEITTIEGLEKEGKLDPVQDAFISEGGIQCGFCTPGAILAAKALLSENPKPAEEEIKEALGGNLCRCTGYTKIIKAVQVAAGQKPPTRTDLSSESRIVGQRLRRRDGFEKATGRAKYVDDITLPGMLSGKVLQSSRPHARIMGIDVCAAEKQPGVRRILTAQDIPGLNLFGTFLADTPVLAQQKVRSYGDAVALVIATNDEAAEKAVQLINVDYDDLPGVFSAEEGLRPGAALVHEKGNLLQHFKLRKGDIQQGFQQCQAVVENTFRTNLIEHAYLETECSVAMLDSQGLMTVWTTTQDVFGVRRQIASVLGLSQNQVRVIQMTTGGGFGGKIDVGTEILSALAAMKTGSPVKVRYSREESMRASPKRHPVVIKARLGASKDGLLQALEGEVLADTGAYASLGPATIRKCGISLSGPYYIPNIKVDTFTVYTNNPTSGAMRGFGMLQSAFAYESLMDMLAEALGKDPWEFRYQNALKPGASISTGQVLQESVGIKATLLAVKKYMEENSLGPQRTEG